MRSNVPVVTATKRTSGISMRVLSADRILLRSTLMPVIAAACMPTLGRSATPTIRMMRSARRRERRLRTVPSVTPSCLASAL
jgi:hypothetical protein